MKFEIEGFCTNARRIIVEHRLKVLKVTHDVVPAKVPRLERFLYDSTS